MGKCGNLYIFDNWNWCFFFFFFLGWLVGGKLVTNWFVIWKKWYYHKSCRSKSRPKVFFFFSLFFDICWQNQLFGLEHHFSLSLNFNGLIIRLTWPLVYLSHTYTHTHKPISSSSELGLIFTISYRFFFLITWNLD